jgi:hypothetical protein
MDKAFIAAENKMESSLKTASLSWTLIQSFEETFYRTLFAADAVEGWNHRFAYALQESTDNVTNAACAAFLLRQPEFMDSTVQAQISSISSQYSLNTVVDVLRLDGLTYEYGSGHINYRAALEFVDVYHEFIRSTGVRSHLIDGEHVHIPDLTDKLANKWFAPDYLKTLYAAYYALDADSFRGQLALGVWDASEFKENKGVPLSWVTKMLAPVAK